MIESFPEGQEFSCLNCGLIFYGDDYTPIDIPENNRIKNEYG